MHINWGDVVAGYAAVVATGALGWQVYQWRSGRAGRLDLTVKCSWRGRNNPYVEGTIYNINDYRVRLDGLTLTVYAERKNPRFGASVMLTPEEAGLPGEVPAHDGVTFKVEGKQVPGGMPQVWVSKDRYRADRRQPVRTGHYLRATVVTSLHHRFSAGVEFTEYHPTFEDYVRDRGESVANSGGEWADPITPTG